MASETVHVKLKTYNNGTCDAALRVSTESPWELTLEVDGSIIDLSGSDLFDALVNLRERLNRMLKFPQMPSATDL